MNVYRIAVSAMSEATKRLDTLARKAVKLGVGGLVYRVTGYEMRDVMVTESDGKGGLREVSSGESEKVAVLEVSAPIIKINGFTPVAQYQLENAGTIVRVFGDISAEVRAAIFTDAQDSDITRRCDHCGVNRTRNNTYVLIAPDGSRSVVGSTCVRDFTGGHDADKIMGLMEDIGSLLEGEMSDYEVKSDKTAYYVDLVEYLENCAACTREYGWGKSDSENPTKYLAADNMRFLRKNDRHAIPITAIDAKEVEGAINWIRNIDLNASAYLRDNEYMHNLKIACAEDRTSPRNTGIVASLVTAWQREQGRQIEYARKAKLNADSNYVGEIGKRIKGLAVTVQMIRDIEGGYGVSRLHTMIDASGNVFVWFASNERLEIGDEVVIDGTPKEHKCFNGVKQTVLTRCKVK